MSILIMDYCIQHVQAGHDIQIDHTGSQIVVPVLRWMNESTEPGRLTAGEVHGSIRHGHTKPMTEQIGHGFCQDFIDAHGWLVYPFMSPGIYDDCIR